MEPGYANEIDRLSRTAASQSMSFDGSGGRLSRSGVDGAWCGFGCARPGYCCGCHPTSFFVSVGDRPFCEQNRCGWRGKTDENGPNDMDDRVGLEITWE